MRGETMKDLEKILDMVNFLGLTHGSLLAEYGAAKAHREQLWKHEHKGVVIMPLDDQKRCSAMAMSDVNDHYTRLVLLYLQNYRKTEEYILQHR